MVNSDDEATLTESKNQKAMNHQEMDNGERRTPRSLALYGGLVLGTVAAGLGSRIENVWTPKLVSTYAGDTLWTVCLFFCLAFVFRKATTWQLFVAAVAGSFLVELSQLYHAPWIDTLRGFKLVALIIGNTFVWSDLICYLAGATLAAAIDKVIVGKSR